MRFRFMPLGLAVLFLQPTPSLAQSAPPSAIGQPGAQASASSSATITLAEAIARAFAHNPGLRAVTQDLEIARGQRLQAGKFANPQLAYLQEGTRKGRRETTVELSQELELGGKRAARISVADRERAIAAADVAAYRANLRADVVTAYFDVLAAQERLALAESSQQLSERATSAAARRVQAGRISPVEETRARVAQASTRIELSQASNELALARRRLAATWGQPGVEVGRVEASPAAVPPRPMQQLASSLASAPQLARARLEVDRQQAVVELERSRRTPNLTVTLGTKRDEEADVRHTVLGVSVPLPFFDRNQGNLLSALRRTDKARDELTATQNRASVELEQASLRLDAARAELALLQSEILPGAQSAYEAASKGFELGKFNFLDVLDAQRTLNGAKAQYVAALASSYRAAAEIERLVGSVDENGRLANPIVQPGTTP